jgi:predicted RNA-binding Zn ribbon-like protein
VPFEHDTEVALASAAALVNTEPDHDRDEQLPDVTALAAFLDEWGWTGDRPSSQGVLARVRALRPRLRALWSAEVPDLVDGVNALLGEYRALPRLVEHDPYGWHVHATADDAPMDARMAVEAAMALVDLVRAGETGRLRTCAGEDCRNVLVDLSRNRSKQYCGIGCANKAHAAAYRARRAEG